MPNQEHQIGHGIGTNGRSAGKPYRDTEWYKKRREDVPAINRGNPAENPFKLLFQTVQPVQAAGNPTDKAGSNQQENSD